MSDILIKEDGDFTHMVEVSDGSFPGRSIVLRTSGFVSAMNGSYDEIAAEIESNGDNFVEFMLGCGWSRGGMVDVLMFAKCLAAAESTGWLPPVDANARGPLPMTPLATEYDFIFE